MNGWKSHRIRVAFASAVALSTLLAACGGNGQGSGAAASVDLGNGPPEAGTVKTAALKGVTLSFVSYGGNFQDGQMAAAVTPFAAESGAKVLQDGPTDIAKIKAQVTSGNVSWDVVDTGNVFAGQQCGKLFQPLDTTIVDTSRIPPGLVAGECSVPAMAYGLIVVYNKEKYGANPPTSWADFYDLDKFPGKRAVEGVTGELDPGVLEGALLADGVPADEIYPLDLDRAIKKLSSIRDDTVFWSTGAQSQQLLEAKQVDIALVWSGRAYEAVKNGAPFAPMWNQWMPEADAISVPIGVKNPKAAFALINYYIGAEQQAKLTELTSYSPINTEAKPKLDALAKSFLTTTPERSEDVFKVDFAWWAENRDEMVSAYTSWLAS